ncbi:MAG: Binding-protein-dependent transporter inner rane component family protein 63 [Firmicutes bacterium]|nr:Binding-protein-dependent transporter inner rane component family protein 63 [Bacillota bacterium]
MWLVASLIFLMIHALPGDPAMAVLGGGDASPTPEQLITVRAKLGLDVPLYEQYLNYFGRLARGNLGESLLNGRPVALDLGLRLPRTLQLIIPTVMISLLLGVPLGIIAAKFRKTWVDPVVSGIALLGFSLPVFVVGTLLVLIFSLKLKWFPPSGWVDFSEQPLEFFRRLTLPVVALTFGPLATTMRMTRTSMLEQLNMDYTRTARAKGLSDRIVIYRHALRNALLPVVTVVGLQFGNMFAGSVLAEYLFNWPGLNNLMFRAIGVRDYPVVQGVVLLSSVMFVLINLLTDVSYALLNPRIRYD